MQNKSITDAQYCDVHTLHTTFVPCSVNRDRDGSYVRERAKWYANFANLPSDFSHPRPGLHSKLLVMNKFSTCHMKQIRRLTFLLPLISILLSSSPPRHPNGIDSPRACTT